MISNIFIGLFMWLQEDSMTIEERVMEEEKLMETEYRLLDRKNFLSEKCVAEGLDRPGNDSLHKPNAWEFLVNRQHHLIWCNVFKAASTSWMYNFNLLAGYKNKFNKSETIFNFEISPRLWANFNMRGKKLFIVFKFKQIYIP